MIFKNCTFFNEEFEKEYGDIEVKNGLITQIGIIDSASYQKDEIRDMSGLILVPGFVDIHIHGAGGGDACDADEASLSKTAAELARHGVTSFCPTTMTLPKSQLEDIVKAINAYKKTASHGAKVIGINLEGPFIAMSKKGAQNGEYVRPGTIEEFDSIYEKSGRLIKLITVAPEAFDSEEFIRHACRRTTVSIGHSAANASECKAAIENGMRHATHLFNAMTPMTHREAGIAGTVLDDERVMCELICDGGHICPTVLRNAFKILGENRGIVISDSMRAAGLGEGEYELGGQTVYVKKDGKYAVLQDGTIAASITNIHSEFKNLLEFSVDFKTALKACTINPARAVGEDKNIGSIAVGKCADLVFLDSNSDIKEVYINGILA